MDNLCKLRIYIGGFVTLTACVIPLTQAVVISCRAIFKTQAQDN